MSAPSSRVVVVTGAAGGIGAAVVRALAARGDRVLATDLRLEPLRERAAAERWPEDRVRLRALDVADPAAWEAALDEAGRAFGPVEVLMNLAGYLKAGQVREQAPEEFSRHLDANARGVMLGTRAAARRMAARGGHVVNMASMAALAPIPGLAAYSASKHAVRAFSIAAAQELAPLGIAVSVVCPDAVQTPMVEAQLRDPEAALTFSGGRILAADEVAALLVGPVLERRPIEFAFPAWRAWLARAANLAPGLAARLRPWLERRGLERQELLRGMRSHR